MVSKEERKELDRVRARKYYAANREQVQQRRKDHYTATNTKPLQVEKTYREAHWYRQGINLTMEQYNGMCDAVGHVCEICENGSGRAGKPCGLDVDHDHSTGAVRGLLCASCNQRLGGVEKHGLCGPHQRGADFAARAVAYMMTATIRRIQQSTN